MSNLDEDFVEEPVGRKRRPFRFEPGRERAIEIRLHRHAIRSIERHDPVVRVDVRPHRFRAAVEPGLRGPDRDPQDVGDGRKRKPLQVMEDDHRAFLDPEAAERSVELVSIDQRRQLIVAGSLVERQLVDFDGSTAAVPARLAMARPDEQPVDPGLEAIRVTERREVTPGGDERLLGCVGCTIRVAQDQAGKAVQAVDRCSRELIERAAIAGHRLFHETSVHPTSGPRASWARDTHHG